MDLTVIIVNWNTRQVTCDCLQSVYEQTRGVEFEVIVVDNASSDDSVEAFRRQFPQVRLIANRENRGFAAANNQGMTLAQGRYVLLLNSDTVVLENAIVRAVGFAEAHPETAVVGCRVLNPDLTLQPTCFMYPSLINLFLSSTYLYKAFPKSLFLGREQMTWWDRNDEREVEVVTGCFMLVRREAIAEVGPLDEQFFMYGEETDWCFRFKQAGWRVLFWPGAQIIHLGGASSKKARPEMILQLRGSILLFLRKHRSGLVYRLACLLMGTFFLLRVPLWLWRSLRKVDPDHARMMVKIYLRGWSCMWGGVKKLILK